MVDKIKNEQEASNDEKEKCIVCRVETEYMFNTPISKREFYYRGYRAAVSKVSL